MSPSKESDETGADEYEKKSCYPGTNADSSIFQPKTNAICQFVLVAFFFFFFSLDINELCGLNLTFEVEMTYVVMSSMFLQYDLRVQFTCFLHLGRCDPTEARDTEIRY